MNQSILPRVILITGTPGVGKTTIGKILIEHGFQVFNLNQFIINEGLYFGYDHTRESVIIDDEFLVQHLRSLLLDFSGILFIEGHTTELVPKEYVDSIVVLRCNPGVLRTRLTLSRDYSKEKIEENVQAEIMDVCLLAVQEQFTNLPIYEIDTTKFEPIDIANQVLKIIGN
ncbi:MAG: AAA family ATPase [Asgard group archaeon]|nr:AAA family ATPase [Asgard group archaeon]